MSSTLLEKLSKSEIPDNENEVDKKTIKKSIDLHVLPLKKEENEPQPKKLESKKSRGEMYTTLESFFRELKEINRVSDRHTDLPRLMKVLEDYEKKKAEILAMDPCGDQLIKFAEYDVNYKTALRRR